MIATESVGTQDAPPALMMALNTTVPMMFASCPQPSQDCAGLPVLSLRPFRAGVEAALVSQCIILPGGAADWHCDLDP